MMRRLLGLCRMMSNKLSSRNCRRSVRSSVAALYRSANRGAFPIALCGIGYLAALNFCQYFDALWGSASTHILS